MTFGLSYFGIDGSLQEVTWVVDRFCSLTRIELFEQIMAEVLRILDEKDMPDTRTIMSAFYEMLDSWKRDTVDHLVGNTIHNSTFKECLKELLAKQDVVPA